MVRANGPEPCHHFGRLCYKLDTKGCQSDRSKPLSVRPQIKHVFVTGNIAGITNIKASMIDGYNVGLQIVKGLWSSPYRQGANVGIIGGDPAGIGTAMALDKHNISFVIWEQGEVFQSIDSYTEGNKSTIFQKHGNFLRTCRLKDTSKETLLNR